MAFISTNARRSCKGCTRVRSSRLLVKARQFARAGWLVRAGRLVRATRFLEARLLIAAWFFCIVVLIGAASSPAVAASPSPPQCSAGTLYLTLDTGNMRHAELIAETLTRHKVKATFFLANEKTTRGDFALDATWSDYWRTRVSEGHAFGSHTFDHVYFKAAGLPAAAGQSAGAGQSAAPDVISQARPQFGLLANQNLNWNASQLCGELNRVRSHFQTMTGKVLDPIWRAPGGRAPDAVMKAAQDCGYQHYYWAEAGFLGDELPSDRYPNQELLARALRRLKDGDVIMAHLGIWSRKDPFGPMFDPLIAGLKSRGFCFATLREHPAYRGVKRP
jgi:peptidoglycan/xylan/chitin deacetylase (PgdA/CDA1 family)